MIVYILILLAFIASSILILRIGDYNINNKTVNKNFIIACVTPSLFLLCFFMGFRYKVGGDYDNYQFVYEMLQENNSYFLNRFEVFFVSLIIFLGNFKDGFVILIFFFYVVTTIITLRTIFYAEYTSYSMYGLATMLFIGIGPIFGIANTIRQGFVVALGLFFTVFFFNRRFIPQVVSAIIGFGIHYSSVAILAISIIPRKVINPVVWIFLVTLLLLNEKFIFINLHDVFIFLGFNPSNFIEHREVPGLGLRFIFEISLFLILSFNCNKLPAKGVFFYNLSFLGLLITFFLKDYANLARIGSYFYIFSFIALPYFLGVFNKFWSYFYFLLLYIYSTLLFLRNLSSDQYVPYQLFFMN